MRTPQTQIEHASPSTVTVDNGSFFNGSDTDVLEITSEETSSEFETENEPSLESISEEPLNEFETETNLVNQESLETTTGDDDFIEGLENQSASATREEQVTSSEPLSEEPRRAQRVPNDLDELRALQDHPPLAEPAVALKTDRLSGITESLGELSPSQLGRSAPQFNSATQSALENEITTVESDLPVLDQPTGLEPGESPVQQVAPSPLERTAEIEQNSDQGTVQTEIEPTPEPEPAQAHSPIIRPTNEQELERAMDGLQVDTQVNTSLGDPPSIDLTGQADPNQVEREQQRNNSILRDTELDEINGFRRDFGENEVYPSIPTEELSTSEELTASNVPVLETEQSFPVMLESDEALLNEDVLAQFDDERTQVITESQMASEEFDTSRAIELENGLESIRNEETNATEEQIRVREENADAISGYREEHQQESEEIISEYETEVDEQRQEHDSDFEEEFETTMDSAESFFDEAEGEVTERERLAAERVAQRRREAEEAENERTWLDDAVDAVTDFFNDLIDAVTQIIDDLRTAVKELFDAVKARVVALIDAARDVLVGMIRAFGNILIQISNLALARFPALRDRVNGLINDSMDWAEQRVNEIAEGLKIVVVAALDFIANAIDTLLVVFQTIIVGALEFFREFTIAILEIAYAFYEELLNIILQIKTIMALVAVSTAANIFLTFAWHFIGQEMKERLIDLYVETLIDIFESAPDDFNHGFLWPLYVNMQLGSLYEMQSWDMDTKIAYFDKLAGMIISVEFWWNFLLGIFVGIWDNIYGILEGIWMLIRFIFYDLWVLIGTVVEKLREIVPEIVALIEEFNIDIHKFIEELKTTGKEKLDEIKNNFTRENIESFFEGLADDLRTKSQVLGGRLAEQARDFMLRDDAYATIGMALGRVTGYLLVEILLAVFTGGIGTAIKWGLKGVKVVVRIVRMLGSVGRAGGLISRVIRFFSNGVKWLIRAIVKFAEKIAKVAKNLFERFKTIFSNLSRRIDDIVARLTGSRPRPRPRPRPHPHPDGPDGPPRRPHGDGPDQPRRPRDRDNDESRAQQELRWRSFKLALSTALNPYRQAGITDEAAFRILRSRAAGFRSVVRLRNPVSSVTRDKGWYKLRVRKIGGIPDLNAEAGEVPIIRRERWNLAKLAIRERFNRVRENQINLTGLTRLLRPFKQDYKFSRLYAEWDQQESDWNIMGAMSTPDEIFEVDDHESMFELFENRVKQNIQNSKNDPNKPYGLAKKEVKDDIREVLNRVTGGNPHWNIYRKIFRIKGSITVEDYGRTKYKIKAVLKKTSNRTRWIGNPIDNLTDGRSVNRPLWLNWITTTQYGPLNLASRLSPSDPDYSRFWDSNYVPSPNRTANFNRKTRVNIPRSQSTSSAPSADVRGKKYTYIGVTKATNHVQPNQILRRTRSSVRRGRAGRTFRVLMYHYGDNLANEQVDHVRDLQYGGEDNFGNLWPLATAKNQLLNRRLAQERVQVQIDDRRQNASPTPSRMIGRWFKIKHVINV